MKEESKSDSGSEVEDLGEDSSSVSPGGERKQRTAREGRMAYSTGGVGGLAINRLNGKNYRTWAVKAEMLLRRESLWSYVSRPPAQLTEEQEEEHERALSTIILSLEDEELVHIQGLNTAKAVWDRLRGIYLRETAGTKISLTRRLYKCQMRSGESASKHLQTMKGLFNELQLMNVVFPEEQKVYLILSSLSSEFNMLITSLESLSDTQLTLEYVTSRILQEEEHWKERFQAAEESHVGADRERRRRSPDGSVSRRRKPETNREQRGRAMMIKACYQCGSRNHLQKDCLRGETFPNRKDFEAAVYKRSAESSSKRSVSLVSRKIRDNFKDTQAAE